VSRDGIQEFISTVHKLNGSMWSINKKFDAEESKDPEDSEYFLTLVKADALNREGGVTPSK
jgi:hypothetical protein